MEEGQGDGSEARVCQGYVWDHQEARWRYRVGKRQREAGEITQVGQQVAVLFIYLFLPCLRDFCGWLVFMERY